MEFSPRVESYSEDASHLGEMLGFFRRECLEYLEGKLELAESYNNAVGWERKLEDGRYCMTQFPHGHAFTAKSLMTTFEQPTKACQDEGIHTTTQPSRQLNFVGFLGRRNPGRATELNSRIDKLVSDLMTLMCDQPDILLYGTAGWSAVDNNHYNLVVLRNEEAGHRWKQCELHMREAIK